jgi:hypothetical protein
LICALENSLIIAEVSVLKPKVFIFAPGNQQALQALRERARDWIIEEFDSLADLLTKAARPLASQATLLMINIKDQEAMEELGRFLAGSLDFDLVLMLQEDEPALTLAALAARPRMVLNGEPDPVIIAAVLEKMHPRMVQRAALLSA